MSAPEQPESYCECLSHVLTDTTPCNSATCALCSKNKRPVDPPDDLVISSSAPDEGAIYWAFRNVKPFKKITEGQSMVNSSIKSIITKRQEREGIKQVVDQLDRQVLVKVIKRLLKQGLFSDPLKAMLKFPHLFPDAMIPEEVQDPPSQENPGHHGTPSKQAPERTKINWDEWSSVAICS
ncbi:hypothetical protein Forpe1208_v017184 [Fusarium oxysporum f. sp. rapae]|uniref:Uncharacterized protein n=1 Tax=Fusarium oxysporum f. sp. rapae TaxID=485398 RepID=A0A8J5TLN5_FUSOX|nr:hypothetical protein Forpe1208_v017184 [Fusarium oxysporum f. sp. rapae]